MEDTAVRLTVKRLMALLLAVCMLLPAFSLAEEAGDDTEVIEEDIILDDDGNEILVDEETGTQFVISSEASELADGLASDYEVDDTVDPDNLELNENLPGHIVNILLVGIDSRSTNLESGLQNGDVQIILSVNTQDGTIKLTSILRDTYVEIPGYKNKNRINVSYNRGGGALAMRTINHNFDLNIQYYVAINFYGLASIIDSIGGIDVDLTKVEAGAINAYLREHPPAYDNNKGGTRVALERKAGVQHLDGVQAVMYARLREIDNDFSRTARQRHLLELLLEEVMKDMDLDKLMTMVESCLPYVLTNMTPAAMLELGLGVLSSGIVQKAAAGETLMEQHRVPMDKTYSYKQVNGASVIHMGPNSFKKNKESIHEFIYGEYIAP